MGLSSLTTRDAGRRISVRSIARNASAFLGSTVPQNLVAIALAGLFVWAAWNWLETLQRIRALYNPLPIWDYWLVPEHLDRYRHFDLSVLWQQHNEHRVIFPEIVFALDILFLHGLQVLPLVLSVLCQFGIWLALAWALASDTAVPWSIRYTAVLIAGVLIGWKGSAMALAIPFLFQWTLSQLAVLLAFAFLARASRQRFLLAAIAAAVIATYSSGNGMLLWPLLILAGLLLRLTRVQMAVLTAAAVLFTGMYFVGYHTLGDLNLSNFISHPVYSLFYLGAYLSMPFGGMKSPQFSANVGITNLAIALGLLVVAFRAGLLASRTGLVLFGSYLFTLLTALLTAAGRMNPSDPLFGSAKAPRYITVPTVNWAVLILLTVWIVSRVRVRFVPPGLICFVTVLLLAVSFPKLRWWLRANNDRFSVEQLATVSIESGLSDPDLLRHVFPDPGFLAPQLAALKNAHLSVYYKGPATWLGHPYSRIGTRLNARAEGAITYTRPVVGGIELVGWADQSDERRRDIRIIFVDDQTGAIIGSGRRFPGGFPLELRRQDLPHSIAWAGFVNSKYQASKLSAYLLSRHGLVLIEQKTLRAQP